MNEKRVKILTPSRVKSWGPCKGWTPERLREIGPLTPLELLRRRGVSNVDKLWVVLRPEVIPMPHLTLLLCAYARRVLPIWERSFPADSRVCACIETTERFARGEATVEELNAAAAAAAAAAASAAFAPSVVAAAYAAAFAAFAANAAFAAFATSAAYAANAAYYAAAANAATERNAQVAMAREVLQKLEKENGK